MDTSAPSRPRRSLSPRELARSLGSYIRGSESDSAVPTSARYWGRLCGLIVFTISLFSLILPPRNLEGVKLNYISLIGLANLVIGFVFLRMSWRSWTIRQQFYLIAIVMGAGLAALGYAYGPVYGPTEMLVLAPVTGVWVGVTQPRFTSLLVTPIIVIDEMVPVYFYHLDLVHYSVTTGVVVVAFIAICELLGRFVLILRRAEAEALEKSDAIQALFDTSPDVISLLDKSGTVLRINDVAANIIGSYEIVGVNLVEGDLVHPDDRYSLKQVLSDIAEGKSTQARIRFRLKNVGAEATEGEWVIFESNIRSIVAPNGAVASMVAIARDVSEQVALEEQLEQAVQVANSANNAKTEFLARMSHEFRTPLNAILGFGQLLERDELDEMAADSVKRIVSAGKHLLSLINEVLDLAKIESGYISLSIENIEIGSVIREVISIMEPLAKSRSVVIRSDSEINNGNHFVVADIQRFKQVMINLVSDAVKYNNEGGFIDISISNMGEKTRIEVSDSGKGIAKKYYDKVFAPFERLGAEQSAVEGTGVGLSLCKKIAEAMNGQLYFTSEEGKGSNFYLELPSSMSGGKPSKEDWNAKVTAREKSGPHGLAGSRKVLYIEDNVANIALVERIFKAWPSLELVTASQGSLGLDLLSADRFDMVLLDLHLPDIQGDEVLRRIKSDPNTAEIPVVILSASAMASDIKALNDQGAAGYLTKPIDVKTLEDTVRFHLGETIEQS